MKKGEEKKERVYEYVLSFTEAKGYPPSVREICTALNIKSTSSVHSYLLQLENDGKLERDPSKPRALMIPELMNKQIEMIPIPMVGKITAGEPILAVENVEDYFQMPIKFVKHDNDLFILRVEGESMIEAGIHSGDYAIIEKASTAANGDIVVALIENDATIKRFFKEKNHIRLQPENSSMKPILVSQCEILGKLVGLYRKF
ncbi:transcriptional repressor LexA [Proteiniclasticum sediminis]